MFELACPGISLNPEITDFFSAIGTVILTIAIAIPVAAVGLTVFGIYCAWVLRADRRANAP